MAEVAKQELDYFKLTPWYHWVLVTAGVGNLVMGVFFPEAVPYTMLGPLGKFLYYMNYSQRPIMYGLLAFAVVAHVGEGLYAYVLTRRMNMNSRSTFLWTFQTTCLGYSSLGPLRAKYKKQKQK